MKLEEGMYVRTNCREEKVIRKIVNIVEDSQVHDHYLIFDKPTKYTYYVEDNNYIAKERIEEASSNIQTTIFDDLEKSDK